MDMFYLNKLAAVVLPDEASRDLNKLLQEGDMKSAAVIEYVLDKVDCSYMLGMLSFEDAVAFYNQMASPERARLFPQRTAPGC